MDLSRNIVIRLGEDKTYLTSMTVAVLAEKRNKTKTVTKVLRTEYGDAEKEFVEVEADGIKYLADFITGTLYNPKTGACLGTSRMSIVM